MDTKIGKTMIIDVDDKISVKKQNYSLDAVINYEMNSRDNRIGEITNVATSILNQFTTDPKWQKINYDNISLLRIVQGKEIDQIKTGVRWQLTKGLRKHLKRLPFFLLYNYPDKLNRYHNIRRKNEHIDAEHKITSNAFHSPSPLNELCDYVNTWEKRCVKWDNSYCHNEHLLVDRSLDLSERNIIRQIKHIINCFSVEMKKYIDREDIGDPYVAIDALFGKCQQQLKLIISDDDALLGNYVIKTSYASFLTNKTLVWQLYGDLIIRNLTNNSPAYTKSQIVEVPSPTLNSKEYLGKYYEMIEGGMGDVQY